MNKIRNIVLGIVSATLGLTASVGVIAQDDSAAIEEVLVTGRKREESLTDVPVSISVFNANALAEQGIDSQEDLFSATPGLDYSNVNGGRGGNNPGVRGVQSDLRASNQQKVASFIDGTPMLGNTGSLQFTGVEAVEIYRGPQSAAFGRSTFAGAINYVTSDSAEEFEGKLMLEASDLNSTQVGIMLSGPITDSLGYRISYVDDDFDGPDEWTATDGTLLGSQETKNFTAKINFEFSDSIYGEVAYNRIETFDQGGASWRADPANCASGSGIWRSTMGVDIEMPSGNWDCDLDAPAAGPGRNNDVLGQFVAQFDANATFYDASVGMALAGLDTDGNGTLSADEYLAQQFADGQTYEQALIGQTVALPGSDRENTRITGELNFEIGDGLLQFLGMTTEDNTDNWNDGDGTGSLAAFSVNMMTMLTSVGANVMSMFTPIDIDETYAEVRWISPEDSRLRYTLSASYYDYSLQQQVFNNGGAIFNNLTIEDTTHANFGQPVNPNSGITISEVATNTGAAFGLNYDWTDRTTFSLEGRYQVDEVCGIDVNGANVEACQETTSFLPRVSINTTLTDTMSVYGQISLGNNPAGVNIAYQDAGNIEALLVASGQIVNPDTGFTYDGSDGVHFATVDYDASTFPTFEEEELTNFEIGTKGSFADRRGAYTAAVYFMVYKNIIGAENLNWDDTTTTVVEDLAAVPPVAGVTGGWNESNWTTFTGERTWLNQGDGEMYGIELTADYAINNIWTVGGYVTLSSAKYTDFCSIQAPDYRDAPGGAAGGGNNILAILTPEADGVLSDCGVVDGNWIPKQTPFTANLNISASLPNELFGMRTSIRGDIRHKGSYYEDHLNLLERDAVTTMNLSANMRSDDWTMRLYVNNLTDNQQPSRVSQGNDYITGANPSVAPPGIPTWSIVAARPREVGLSVQYEF